MLHCRNKSFVKCLDADALMKILNFLGLKVFHIDGRLPGEHVLLFLFFFTYLVNALFLVMVIPALYLHTMWLELMLNCSHCHVYHLSFKCYSLLCFAIKRNETSCVGKLGCLVEGVDVISCMLLFCCGGGVGESKKSFKFRPMLFL